MLKRILLVLFILMSFCFAQETKKSREILPRKGQVTKNIHIVFDKSGSMTMEDFKLAYAEVQAIAMQGVDDFSVAVTVFGQNHERMKPLWMKMPSMDNYKKIVLFLRMSMVSIAGTNIAPAIADILKEKKKDVSVIVITDGSISDVGEVVKLFKKYKGPKISIGVVDTDGPSSCEFEQSLYSFVKKNNHWYVDLKQPEEDEDE